MALTQTQVSQLYVSIFGRASEGEGNTYWQTNQEDMTSTANVMLATAAAEEYFGDTLDDDQGFIEFIYNNTLGKTVDEDPDGIAYWVAELEAGKSKGEVVTALINAAQAEENAGDAQDQFNNKVAISDYTADNLDEFTNYVEFQSFIADVDASDASVAAAKEDVDGGGVPKAEFTTGTDTVTGAGTFNAALTFVDAAGAQVQTLQTGDSVAGTGDADILNFAANGTNAVPMLNGVETINMTSFAATALNLSLATGVTTLASVNSVANATFTNVDELPAEFKLDNVMAGDLIATIAAPLLAGTADTAQVTVDGVNSVTTDITLNVTGSGSNVYETVNITSEGAASVMGNIEIGNLAVTSTWEALIVDGTADLTISGNAATAALATTVTSIDASTFEGALVLGSKANGPMATADHTITTGAGDDMIFYDANDLDRKDTIDMGDGVDALALVATTGPTATLSSNMLSNVSNVDAIGFADTFNYNITTPDDFVAKGGTLIVDASTLTGTGTSNTLTFDGSDESDGSFVITGGDFADTITGGDLADTIDGGKGVDVITGGGGADVITLGKGADTVVFNSFAAADEVTDFENLDDAIQIALKAAGKAGSTIAANGALGASLTTGASASFNVLNNAGGSAGVNMTGTTTLASSQLFLASDLTALTQSITANAAASVVAFGRTSGSNKLFMFALDASSSIVQSITVATLGDSSFSAADIAIV